MPKVIKSAGRDIVLKVKRACEEERDNNGPTVPFSKVRARVAYLTGNFRVACYNNKTPCIF